MKKSKSNIRSKIDKLLDELVSVSMNQGMDLKSAKTNSQKMLISFKALKGICSNLDCFDNTCGINNNSKCNIKNCPTWKRLKLDA